MAQHGAFTVWRSPLSPDQALGIFERASCSRANQVALEALLRAPSLRTNLDRSKTITRKALREALGQLQGLSPSRRFAVEGCDG